MKTFLQNQKTLEEKAEIARLAAHTLLALIDGNNIQRMKLAIVGFDFTNKHNKLN